MTLRGFLFFSVSALALPVGLRGVESDTRGTFRVEPGCTLVVDSYRGSVIIEESDAAEVRVRLHVEADADTEEQAARMRSDLQLEMNAASNVVTITARNPRESRVRIDFGDRKPLDLDYRISVPRACNVKLKVRNGSITVGSLTGEMLADVETGNIFFRRIDGRISASVQMGDITVSRCTGDITARVMHGMIRLGTIGGRAELKNSSGPIEVLTAKGAVSASAQAGDVTVGFGRAVGTESRLTTSGGNVFVMLDPRAACRVDATSVWGRVHTALPFAIESGGNRKSRLAGRLNGGGPMLTFRASGGHVRISSGDVPFDEE